MTAAQKARIEEILQLSQRLTDKEKRQRSQLNREQWQAYTRSVWSYSDTVTHSATEDHPSQFSAEVANRLIQMYSCVDDIVVDPFVGSGTTLFEAQKLSRFSVGVDVNPQYVERVQAKLEDGEHKPVALSGDAREMSFLPEGSTHLVIAHPPYWNVVSYGNLSDDLSSYDYDSFLDHMKICLEEFHRILQPDRMLAIVTGDVFRRVDGRSQLYPLHAEYINLGRSVGFRPWDVYIWETTLRLNHRGPAIGSYPYPVGVLSQFAHNYVVVLRKTS